jgi:hypothetical protein
MEQRRVLLTTLFLLGPLVALPAYAEPARAQAACTASKGVQRNEALETTVPPDGRLVFSPRAGGFVDTDGALGIKWPWIRRIPGDLIVGGRRLDGVAAPARAYMNFGYGSRGFQATYLVFPSPGCWEITGRIADRSLTFVVQVEQEGNGPSWKYEGLPRDGFWYQTTLEAGRSVASPPASMRYQQRSKAP